MVFDFGWWAVCRYGPEPIALPLIASSQAPGREKTCFGMIFARVSRETPSGKGNLSTSSTFFASIFFTSFSQLAKKPLRERLRLRIEDPVEDEDHVVGGDGLPVVERGARRAARTSRRCR